MLETFGTLGEVARRSLLEHDAFYNSSSSSILGFLSLVLGGVPVVGGVLDRTESRAALMLWVAAYLSGLADWSMLGLCFFRGLPTRASSGTSAGAREEGPGVVALVWVSWVEDSPAGV